MADREPEAIHRVEDPYPIDRYRVVQLLDVLDTIDRRRYPDRYREIVNALTRFGITDAHALKIRLDETAPERDVVEAVIRTAIVLTLIVGWCLAMVLGLVVLTGMASVMKEVANRLFET